MELISDTGAIRDISEIAAGLSQEEDDRIEAISLENLLDELQLVHEQVEDIPAEEVEAANFAPAFESLVGMITSIRENGSISRTEALTLRDMTASMEGFESTFESLPIQSFTELPSKVNFQPSMEGLLGNIARSILQAIKKAIEWVRMQVRSFVSAMRVNLPKAKAADAVRKQASSNFKAKKFEPDAFTPELFTPNKAKFQTFGDYGSGVNVKSNQLITMLCAPGINKRISTAVNDFTSEYAEAPKFVTMEDLEPLLSKLAQCFNVQSAGGSASMAAKATAMNLLVEVKRLASLEELVPINNVAPLLDRYHSAAIDMPSNYCTLMTTGLANALSTSNNMIAQVESSIKSPNLHQDTLEELRFQAFFHKDVTFILNQVYAVVGLVNTASVTISKTLFEGVQKAA
ncbi:hypothetical protein D9M68_19500 [compost metagenome]